MRAIRSAQMTRWLVWGIAAVLGLGVPAESSGQTGVTSVGMARIRGTNGASGRTTAVIDSDVRWSGEWSDFAVRARGMLRLDLGPYSGSRREFGRAALLDVGELLLAYGWEDAEIEVGLGTVAWGVSESRSPVDVLTPRAVLWRTWEGHELGQPIVDFMWFTGVGTVQFVFLPATRPVHMGEFDWTTWDGRRVQAQSAWDWNAGGGVEFATTSGAFDWTVSYTDSPDRTLGTVAIPPPGSGSPAGPTVAVDHPRTRQLGVGVEWVAGGGWTAHAEGVVARAEDAWGSRMIVGAEWSPLPFLSVLVEQGLTRRGARARNPIEDDLLLGAQLIGERIRARARLYIDPGSGTVHPDVALRIGVSETTFLEASWIEAFGNAAGEPALAVRQPGFLQILISRYF